MERNLQDDINSLTLKNTILRQLLDVISEHEGEDKPASGKEPQLQSPRLRRLKTSNNNETAGSAATEPALANSDLGSDSVIAKHINRLPHDIQVSLKSNASEFHQMVSFDWHILTLP